MSQKHIIVGYDNTWVLVHTEAKTGQISWIRSLIEWVLYPF